MVHLPCYQTPEGYSLEAGPQIAKETVRYEALVSQVELLVGGELTAGSARRLSDRGWGLLMSEEDTVAYIRQAGKGWCSDSSCTVSVTAAGAAESIHVTDEVAVIPAEVRALRARRGRGEPDLERATYECLVATDRAAASALIGGERVALLEAVSGQFMVLDPTVKGGLKLVGAVGRRPDHASFPLSGAAVSAR